MACAECGATGPETRTGYGPNESWYAAALKEWNDRPAEAAVLASARERVEAERMLHSSRCLCYIRQDETQECSCDETTQLHNAALDAAARAITEAT